jgi:hypothetical protein
MKKILSIDGGGIRGIIPALILESLETKTGLPTAKFFDLVAGTSTGGILAMGLARPDDKDPSVPRYRAANLVDLYRQNGGTIFSRSLWRGVASIGGLVEETYPASGLESVLLEFFAESTLGASLTKVLVPSYEMELREPYFFKSWKPNHAGLPIRLVSRATSAAPTYFEPATIVSAGVQADLVPDDPSHDTFRFIDGGVYINSPALSAYAEARRLWPEEEIRVLSLGTGELTRPIPYAEAKDWGKLEWMLPAMNCMFDGVSKAVDYQMRAFPDTRYLRIQGSLEHCSDDMDNTTNGNLANLTALANALIERHAVDLEAVANWH